jgi:hypothetical protein
VRRILIVTAVLPLLTSVAFARGSGGGHGGGAHGGGSHGGSSGVAVGPGISTQGPAAYSDAAELWAAKRRNQSAAASKGWSVPALGGQRLGAGW